VVSQPKTHLPGVLLTAFEKMAQKGRKTEKVQLLDTLLTLHGGCHANLSFFLSFLAINSLSCKGSGLSLACLLQNNPVEEKVHNICSIFWETDWHYCFKSLHHIENIAAEILYSVQNATALLTYTGWGHKSKQVTKPAVRCRPCGFTRLWGLWISGHAVDTKNYSHWRLMCE